MMNLVAGHRLGPYEIISALGAGGMGEVYRARDTKLNRDVAIKVLLPAVANDPDRLARFSREAQVLASLNHPNIAHIHGLEEADGVTALVLELVEGEDLAQRIARGPIPLDEALPIARQIADALEAAHEQGIIHRDLKPANIKVRPDGTVKVLDFGLAKAMDPAGGSSANAMNSPTLSLHATQAGIILGTAAYMSPEQARGSLVDRRADLWAVGVVLHEMLTGTRLFEGATISDTLAAILRAEPDWRTLPADTPIAIRRLLRRCLEKDRKRRLPDAADVRLEIDDAMAGGVETPPTSISTAVVARPAWRRAMPIVCAAMVGGLLIGAAAWSVRPAPSPPQAVTRFPVALPQSQLFTNAGRQLIAVSPDGTAMVYVANYRVFLRSMSEIEARPIAGTEGSQGGVTNPVFSPDGRSIVFWSAADRTLKKIAVSGGTAVTVCPADPPYGMSWGADGIVVGQGTKGIMRVSASGGKPEWLVTLKADEVAEGPQILPGGQAVLFTLATATGADAGWDKAHIVVQSLKSGERKTLVEGGSNASYVPTGHLVYALGGTLLGVPFDLPSLAVTGGSTPIVEGVRLVPSDFGPMITTGSAQFSFSHTGSLVYIPGPASAASAQLDLAFIDRQGAVEPLKLPPGPYEFPRISPDGKRIAFGSDDGKEAIVWIYELSGANPPRRLTFGGRNRFPIWSADGGRVVYQSDRGGDLGVFWQRADGSGTAERLTTPDQGTAHRPDSWSPKGETFLFEVTKGASYALWSFSLKDRKAAPFGDVQSSLPRNAIFSPDGRWVAYQSNESGVGSVFVQPFPATGAKYQIAKGTGALPFWSPDGKALFYGPGVGQWVVVSVNTQPSFTVGNPVPVPRGAFKSLGPGFARNNDIMPDGKRIIGVIQAGQTPSDGNTTQILVVLNWFEELKARVPTK